MAADDTLRLGELAQKNIVQYLRNILEQHARNNELRSKFELIDIAYARYKQVEANGQDGLLVLNDEFEQAGLNFEDINIPIVVSHVDSYVGYFADVFLSGYPMFPVVSTPDSRMEAEALNSIIDTHAKQGRYARQLMMSFYDDAKYNLSSLEVDWCPLDDFSLLSASDSIKRKGSAVKADNSTYYNKIRRWDPYNTILDTRVLPPDIPLQAEFHGLVEMISYVELKKRLAQCEKSGNGYNTSQAMESSIGKTGPGAVGSAYYKELPQISSILSSNRYRKGNYFDWDAYLTGTRSSGFRNYSSCYEWVTLYCRIVPSRLNMNVPEKGTPQVWKFQIVNHEKLVYAARQFNVYDSIPCYVGQPMEDGFSYQTQSIAENSVPFQEGTSKLFSIRLNSARRAVMDRAVFDPQVIDPTLLNNANVAPKIPIRDNSLMNGKKMTDAYHQIPFDSRGTETVVQDMLQMFGFADRLNGINQPFQGQFQKGNKTRKEWDDTMEGATNRLRLRGLSLEMQQIIFIKEQIKFNIYKNNPEGNYQSQSSGMYYKVTPELLAAIKEKISSFELADGMNPASKIASTDVLVQGLQAIQSSPLLAQTLGPMLPQMFIHMMSLGGVKKLEQYLPTQPITPQLPPQQ